MKRCARRRGAANGPRQTKARNGASSAAQFRGVTCRLLKLCTVDPWDILIALRVGAPRTRKPGLLSQGGVGAGPRPSCVSRVLRFNESHQVRADVITDNHEAPAWSRDFLLRTFGQAREGVDVAHWRLMVVEAGRGTGVGKASLPLYTSGERRGGPKARIASRRELTAMGEAANSALQVIDDSAALLPCPPYENKAARHCADA